jgi:hypothetical protein
VININQLDNGLEGNKETLGTYTIILLEAMAHITQGVQSNFKLLNHLQSAFARIIPTPILTLAKNLHENCRNLL